MGSVVREGVPVLDAPMDSGQLAAVDCVGGNDIVARSVTDPNVGNIIVINCITGNVIRIRTAVNVQTALAVIVNGIVGHIYTRNTRIKHDTATALIILAPTVVINRIVADIYKISGICRYVLYLNTLTDIVNNG